MAIDVIVAESFLVITAGIAIFFGIFNAAAVYAIDMEEVRAKEGEHSDDEFDDDKGQDRPDFKKIEHISKDKMTHMLDLAGKISDGANSFLFKEYGYMIVFCILFGIVIFFLAETNMGEFWTVIAFEVGAATSIISGFIGMRIAVTGNVRTTKECAFSLSRGFVVAYKAGSVLGFTLVGLALMVLVILLIAYRLTYLP